MQSRCKGGKNRWMSVDDESQLILDEKFNHLISKFFLGNIQCPGLNGQRCATFVRDTSRKFRLSGY